MEYLPRCTEIQYNGRREYCQRNMLEILVQNNSNCELFSDAVWHFDARK